MVNAVETSKSFRDFVIHGMVRGSIHAYGKPRFPSEDTRIPGVERLWGECVATGGGASHFGSWRAGDARPAPQSGTGGSDGEGFQVLAALADLPEEVPLSELIAIVDAPRAILSDTLTRLEYSSLIERRRGELDRRMIRLRLTPAGRKATANACSLVQKSIRQILHGMNEDSVRGMMVRCEAITKEAKAIGL